MKFWWKIYGHEWKMNLFLVIQMILVLFFVNDSVSSLQEQWKVLTCMENTQDNLYFYSNALSTIGTDGKEGWRGFRYAENKLKQLDGMESLAYTAYTAGTISENREVYSYNMSETLWKSIQYSLEEGRWFWEEEKKDDIFQVIIGGGLSEEYQVGDTFEVKFADGTVRNALVIGDMGEEFYMLENADMFSADGGQMEMFVGLHTKEENVILSYDEKWFEDFRDEAVYPASSVMLQVRQGADLNEYQKYGVLSSFDKIMENTKERCQDFLMDAINYNAIWVLVILFGVAGVAYLSAQKRRYLFGVLSLYGMSEGRMLGMIMIQNLLTYLTGAVIACFATPYLAPLLNYRTPLFTGIHIIVMGILILWLLLVSFVCNLYLKRMEPKEILIQTKE